MALEEKEIDRAEVAAAPVKRKADVQKTKSAAGAGDALINSESAPAKAEMSPAPSSDEKSQDSRLKIKELVASLSGKIIKEEADSLYLEIPTAKYDDFVKNIAAYGKLTTPGLPAGSAKYPSIKIKLTFSH